MEASQCVKSLQSVFDTTNASTFASRFDEWRKVDLKATAQMQQHVKELVRLNDAIDDFLGRSATPEEFSSFKDAVGSMLRCSSELRDARKELKEADHWREETQKLDDTLKETKTELNEVRIAEKQARSEAASLDRRLGDIRQELACVQGDLGIARAGSLVNGMTRLREIEARGAVKINRQMEP